MLFMRGLILTIIGSACFHARFTDRGATQVIYCVCHKYNDLIFVEFLIFFQRTKLRQPTGQRQLLENKQILRNIQDF